MIKLLTVLIILSLLYISNVSSSAPDVILYGDAIPDKYECEEDKEDCRYKFFLLIDPPADFAVDCKEDPDDSEANPGYCEGSKWVIVWRGAENRHITGHQMQGQRSGKDIKVIYTTHGETAGYLFVNNIDCAGDCRHGFFAFSKNARFSDDFEFVCEGSSDPEDSCYQCLAVPPFGTGPIPCSVLADGTDGTDGDIGPLGDVDEDIAGILMAMEHEAGGAGADSESDTSLWSDTSDGTDDSSDFSIDSAAEEVVAPYVGGGVLGFDSHEDDTDGGDDTASIDSDIPTFDSEDDSADSGPDDSDVATFDSDHDTEGDDDTDTDTGTGPTFDSHDDSEGDDSESGHGASTWLTIFGEDYVGLIPSTADYQFTFVAVNKVECEPGKLDCKGIAIKVTNPAEDFTLDCNDGDCMGLVFVVEWTGTEDREIDGIECEGDGDSKSCKDIDVTFTTTNIGRLLVDEIVCDGGCQDGKFKFENNAGFTDKFDFECEGEGEGDSCDGCTVTDADGETVPCSELADPGFTSGDPVNVDLSDADLLRMIARGTNVEINIEGADAASVGDITVNMGKNGEGGDEISEYDVGVDSTGRRFVKFYID